MLLHEIKDYHDELGRGLSNWVAKCAAEAAKKFGLPQAMLHHGGVMYTTVEPNMLVIFDIPNSPAISKMVDADDDDSEEMRALQAKMTKRGVDNQEKKREAAIRWYLSQLKEPPTELKTKLLAVKIEDDDGGSLPTYKADRIPNEIHIPTTGMTLSLRYSDPQYAED